jgi:dihydrofolate reductase
VLTHRPPKTPRDPAVTFLTGDIGDAIATARKAAGGKNVEIFGADLTGQCLERGLIDEIAVHIVPVLLGAGTPFSSSVRPARVDLEPLSSTHSGTVTTMRFRVRK